MSTEADAFCLACILGDLKQIRDSLSRRPDLVRARGSVHPQHRDHMKRENAESGWTPLHLAAHYGQLEAVRLLLEAGADANALADNPIGNTPLMAAVAGNQPAIARALLEAGADPDRTDRRGEFSARLLARASGKPELVGLFDSSPASPR